jgi:hypothetical protein
MLLSVAMTERGLKDCARTRKAELRERIARGEEENRRVREAATDAAHKSEVPDHVEELQRHLSDAAAEIEGMEPSMGRWRR